MPVYSRKAKYEELRKSLQNESETGPQQTPELSPYIERLNKIAPGNFEAPEVNAPETLPPVQPRRAQIFRKRLQPADVVGGFLERQAICLFAARATRDGLYPYVRQPTVPRIQLKVDTGNGKTTTAPFRGHQ